MHKYSVGVNRDFLARHYLVGGDFGDEGVLHSHHYRVEVVVSGDRLSEHDFLVDIVTVKESSGALIERFRETTLNDLPELEGRNPSCEAVASVLAAAVREALRSRGADTVEAVSVKVWEDELAWAECRLDVE
jgi:6-pyruvoyltetrahydropterin/6-carboxytetrahydropterin synthase